MASSIASYIVLSTDLSSGRDVAREVPLQNINIHIPKLSSVDKIGGIFCKICDIIFEGKKEFEAHYITHNEPEITYTCLLCKKDHYSYPSFRNHCYLQHVMKHKFGCNQCNKTFSKQCALKAHITAIHEFKCGECDEKFKTKKDLQIHKIIHNRKSTSNPPYKCTTCKQVIESLESCEEHLNDHCEVLYPCPICALVLPNKKEAIHHLTEHFEDIPTDSLKSDEVIKNSAIDLLGGILCCHCDQLYKDRSEIESHFAGHHDDKDIVYTCNICEKQYTKYSLFGNHCHFHANKGKFKCEECNRLFPRLPLLVMHNLAFHCQDPVEKPYRCDCCIYSFKSHYRLLEHKRLVHNDVTLKCHVPGCTATFNTPKELVTHQQEHKSCLDNWCRQCGLQFATRAACERHLDVHCRTQYACPVCGRTYRERYLLLKHAPKHFESVLHICKICGRSYSARNRLIEHTKTHTNKKKHQCTYCPKSFSRPFELEQHERVHTGDKPYVCTVCYKTFASYPNWTKHLTRAHAFDKNKIKEVREARKQNPTPNIPKTSPLKAESGIESAGSEVSDLNGLVDSDSDDADIIKLKSEIDQSIKLIMETIDTKIETGNKNESTAVDSVLERIDDDVQLLSPVEISGDLSGGSYGDFEGGYRVDDSSDIKAIVEHIDALSGDMDMPTSQPEMLQFTDILSVDNVYDTVPAFSSPALPEPTYYQPTSVPLEYGPDFNTLGTTYTDIGNEVLPHIDPLLTIKEENSEKYVQNVPNVYNEPNGLDRNWQPYITKVFTYDESNDNRMYVLNGNIF